MEQWDLSQKFKVSLKCSALLHDSSGDNSELDDGNCQVILRWLIRCADSFAAGGSKVLHYSVLEEVTDSWNIANFDPNHNSQFRLPTDAQSHLKDWLCSMQHYTLSVPVSKYNMFLPACTLYAIIHWNFMRLLWRLSRMNTVWSRIQTALC